MADTTQNKLRITLIRSTIGRPGNQGLIVEALGLRKVNQTVVRPDVASVRGMVNKISHLLRVEEVPAG